MANLHRVMNLPIDYVHPDEPLATPEQAMSWPEHLLVGVIAVAATFAVAAFAYIAWPLFVAAVS
jgi:hypothetical protein